MAEAPQQLSLELPGVGTPLTGHRGILSTSRIQYNDRPTNLLGRHLEYTVAASTSNGRPLEVSLQLYLNINDHWRLFAYSRAGMLLSLNLTTLRERGPLLELGQTIVVRTVGLSAEERLERTESAANALRVVGADVSEHRKLLLATFDSRAGKFLDTTPPAFIRSFVQCAVLMGHFRGNKGYTLPINARSFQLAVRGLPNDVRVSRAVPLGMRYEVFRRDRSTCQACGKSVEDGAVLHADHIVPYSLGGLTTLENLQALCSECNLGKGNRSSGRTTARRSAYTRS